MTSTELLENLELLNLKDESQEIVIKPVAIEHERDHRASVILSAGLGEDIRPKLGIYSIEGQFVRPTQVNKWVMVFLFDKQAIKDLAEGKYTFDDIKEFAKCYVSVGRSRGITITQLASIQCIPSQATAEKNVENMPSQDLKLELRRLFIKLNDNLVNHAIIILPDNAPSWIHSYLQYLETCKWDRDLTDRHSLDPVKDKLMRTSRIRLKTLVDLSFKSSCRGKRSLIPQLWLKYNTKLGGLNVTLKRTFDTHDMKFLNDGHLIISIDLVQQEGPQSLVSPFVSVAVGMWDLASPKMSFNTQTRVQACSDRVDLVAVEELEQMISEIIMAYKRRKDNQIPTRVLVFRAGSYKRSDNEFIIREIVSIKKALKDAHSLQEASGSGEQVKYPVLTYLKVPKKKVIRKYQNNAKANAHRPAASTRVVRTSPLVDEVLHEKPSELPPLVKSQFPPAVKHEFPPVIKRDPKGRQWSADKPKSNLYKLYDEANMSIGAVQAMVYALSYLSPRVTAMTRPTPIDFADLAGERTHNIVLGWMEENKINLKDTEFLLKVNQFLASEMGDSTYKDHLYYV